MAAKLGREGGGICHGLDGAARLALSDGHVHRSGDFAFKVIGRAEHGQHLAGARVQRYQRRIRGVVDRAGFVV